MAVSFQLPLDLEQNLRHDFTNLNREAKEAFLVTLYRQGKLSHLALSQALSLDRFETEELLHKHNVTEDLGTLGDYLKDARTLEKVRAAGR
jgi:predicted HTH domain antitoxin